MLKYTNISMHIEIEIVKYLHVSTHICSNIQAHQCINMEISTYTHISAYTGLTVQVHRCINISKNSICK